MAAGFFMAVPANAEQMTVSFSAKASFNQVFDSDAYDAFYSALGKNPQDPLELQGSFTVERYTDVGFLGFAESDIFNPQVNVFSALGFSPAKTWSRANQVYVENSNDRVEDVFGINITTGGLLQGQGPWYGVVGFYLRGPLDSFDATTTITDLSEFPNLAANPTFQNNFLMVHNESTSAFDLRIHDIRWNISTSSAPEPATWLTMIVGFGLVGLQLRRPSTKKTPAFS